MIFDRAGVAATFGVSRETLARLDALVAHLVRWQRRINLIGPRTLPAIWHRHIADSAQLFTLAPTAAATWCDLGAGAGFPGLVIAAMAADARPGLHVTLIESDSRKAAFLTSAAQAMGVSVTVFARRIEALPQVPQFDVISARALAPLPALVAMARPLLRQGGMLLFPKGAEAEAELALLHPIDREAVTRLPSQTQPAATILSWT